MAAFRAENVSGRQTVDERALPDNRPTSKRRLNVRLLPVSVVVFALLYALTGYRGWLVFFAGTSGVWLLAWVWLRSLEKGLSVERQVHLAWANAGEAVPEQLKLTNTGWLPAIWVEINDASPALPSPLRLVSDVEPHASRTRHFNHLFKRRGLYTLGPTRLRSGDPFGIYTLTLNDPQANTILVTPPVLPLAGVSIAPGGFTGDANRRRGALEREISDAGLRDYLPGDSLRRIHWGSSAHHDNLVVRQLEAAASRDWWIFVDLEASVQAGSGDDSTLELAIVLATSLAVRGLKEHRRVGLALAGPQLVWLEPRTGPAAQWQMLRALAVAAVGQRSLSELLKLEQATRTARQIVLTPSVDPAWVAAAGGRGRANDLTVILIDPLEFGVHRDQSRLVASLAQHGIPFTRVPRSLLSQAYHLSGRYGRQATESLKNPPRYLRQGRQTWQSMD
jgi:uncharacterized protein (DUF58 family)